MLCGKAPLEPARSELPAPSILPPAERRRASRVIKLTLALGLEAAAHAGADPATLATVFTASGGDGYNCHALCEQLAGEDRRISPIRFHNSVHNAAAGYWGIATRSMAPSQVLCGFDGSFGAGLIDALAQVEAGGEPVLLIAYDSEYPEPLFSKRNTPDCGGIALLLRPLPAPPSFARIAVEATRDPAATMADAGLEQLRRSIPAMRALPLMQQLARGAAGRLCIDYLPPMQLNVDIEPC